MNMTKLDQIENLLHTLITILKQKLQSNDSYGIVTQKELLKILQISPNTLKSWESKGLKRLEPPIEGTRTIFYKMKDVIDFLTI
ncbi:phage protein [Streptococcus pneumoniae]|uniref:MerR family transcriptional regulator n=1 Tax=Streptococcus pneumoniae TaxID=1313 RepID=UPI0010247DD6|nr:MerR family transcriptional regulator [Streptococcus pneumoniae]MDD0783409.1 MerR family transcriptional regulator [Streptococcus pneumoniae]MDG9153079.1 MerR family transcriptional regulator [Streptococcus pneumoniae]MDG9312480.1 MerR family transcriptional regulator [Streptococcus pneumoniae]MDG9329317.1 MerR family transcriptional regulator [Streptococcus pneumoniae]MDS2435805.1 MerR family transcriptional regulator [Streptococcus pneumoniae]